MHDNNFEDSFVIPQRDRVFNSDELLEMGELTPREIIKKQNKKAVIAAIIGVIPAIFITMIIGNRFDFYGFLFAFGAIFCVMFVTDDDYPKKNAIIVCVSVMAVAILLSTHLMFCGLMHDKFLMFVEENRETICAEVTEYGMTEAEIQEQFDKVIKAKFGFTEVSVINLFFHFWKSINNFGLLEKYFSVLIYNYIWAGLGSFTLFLRYSYNA